jgi:hypothetical protein
MTMLSMLNIRRGLCCWLIFTNIWISGYAQTQPAGTPAQAPAEQGSVPSRTPSPISSLKIFVLEGSDAIHVPGAGYTPPLVVEVRDQNDLPVEGAEVIFQLPSSGPSGLFPGQKLVFKTKTNYQGQAEAAALQPNNHLGTFTIVVTAALGELKRSITVNQSTTNNLEALTEKRRSRKWLWIGLIGAAVAGTGIYFATRGGSSTAGASTITLTPGSATIGAPR